MEKNSVQLSPRKLKKFIRHLCISSKVIHERENAHKQLDEHLARLKQISSEKPGLGNRHINELRERIDNAIQAETKALNVHKEEPFKHKKLKEKITSLDTKLDKIANAYTERQKRLQHLEKKIAGQHEKEEKIKQFKELISILEKRYQAMQSEYSQEDLEKIRNKIDSLKVKIEKLAA